MGASLVQEKEALPGGVVLTDTNKRVNILDRKEDNYWDTVILGDRTAPYAVPANTIISYFTQVSTKGRHLTAFNTDNRIIGNEQILVTKLGVVPKLYWGQTLITDASIKSALEGSYLEFRKNDNIKKKGPPVFWQSGYGFAGATMEANDVFSSIGVPSPAAIPDLLRPFELHDDDNIEMEWRFPGSTLNDTGGNAYQMPALATPVVLMVVFHGFIVRSGLRD